jgi:transcriptional regulator with XRE-family HTH domain
MRKESEIGEAIRYIRKEKGFTLNALAEKSGFSQGFLSKVENSQKAPSIATLIRIANALNVRISDIFGETELETPITHVRKNERKKLSSNGLYEALAPQFHNRHMDPYILKDSPGKSTNPVVQHEGEEMLFVLEGRMKFFHGNKEFIVEEGDCIYYDSGIPHTGFPVGDKELKCLMVVYNPDQQARGHALPLASLGNREFLDESGPTDRDTIKTAE